MKYAGSKLVIMLGAVIATISVWTVLAWPAWQAGPPNAAPSAVVEPVATVEPPPPAVPVTPQPVNQSEPEIVVRRIVYVPVSAAASTSGGGVPEDAVPGAPGDAEPPPASAPIAPNPAPVGQQPAPNPAPEPTARPVAPAPPPAPITTIPAVPAPTPISSGGS